METIGLVLVCIASGLQALGIIALRQMNAMGDLIDDIVMIFYISVLNLIINSGALLVADTSPVRYSQTLWQNLFLISACSAFGMVLSNQMYQHLKVSWSILILNL